MSFRRKFVVSAAAGLGLCAASASLGFAQSYRYDASPAPAYRSSEAPPWVAVSKADHPTPDIVGDAVVDFKGKPIGRVTDVVGNQVVVEYDEYLSMPHATGVFPWRQLDPSADKTALLTTYLSKGQMEGLPPRPG